MGSSQLLLLFILLSSENVFPDEMKKIEAPDVERRNVEISHDYSSCDLTENKCDVNCCFDQDCNSWERNSFNCDEIEEYKLETFVDLSEKECDIGESGPILCLHHSNSPYLGKFYQESDTEDQPIKVKKEPWNNNKPSIDTNLHHKLAPADKLKYHIPYNVFGKSGFCLPMPIRIPENSVSNCLYSISEETCLTNKLFNISNFLTRESQYMHDHSDNITLTPEVICLKNGSDYVTISRNIFRGNAINEVNGQATCSIHDFTELNKSIQICKNVVVGLKYIFNVNKLRISSGKLIILLANIPVNVNSYAYIKNQSYDSTDLNNSLYLYVSQSVSVFFNNTENNVTILKDGYKIRQSLAYL